MANSQQSQKGNPASKRMSNKHRKEYRSQLWYRQQERKRKNREAQQRRAARNRQLIAEGMLTPWQQSKVNAKNRKAPANA